MRSVDSRQLPRLQDLPIVFAIDVDIVKRALNILSSHDSIARLDWREEDISTAGYSCDVEYEWLRYRLDWNCWMLWRIGCDRCDWQIMSQLLWVVEFHTPSMLG